MADGESTVIYRHIALVLYQRQYHTLSKTASGLLHAGVLPELSP